MASKVHQAIISNLPVVLFSVDRTGIFTLSEGKGLAALGLQPGQVVGLNVRNVYRDFPHVVAGVERALDGKTFTGVVEIGSLIFEIWYSPLVNVNNQVVGMTGVASDITQRKRAEQSLRESEERFRALIQSSSDVVMLTDQEGAILYESPAVERVLGYTPAERIGTKGASIFHPEDIGKAKESLKKLLTHPAETILVQGRGQHKDGSWRWIEFAGANMLQRPSVHALVINYRDITDRINAEEAVRQSQKIESLGILAGGVAHDFNNLLQAILGHTSLAKNRLSAAHPAFENIEKTERAAERAADLTRQLLAYSGRGRFDIKPINLNSLIRENLPLLEVAIHKNVSFRQALSIGLPDIMADTGQMQQIIMNLLINASEAIGTVQGTITITTRILTLFESDFSKWTHADGQLQPGDYVLLEIADTGSGMDAATLAKIFDPFFTTKFTGRGLGLSAVLGIVRGHSGGLQVESAVGVGTTFRMIFPALETSTPVKPDHASGNTLVSTSQAVLVIDDELDVRNVIVDMLQDAGLHARTASDGESGVKIYQEHRHEIGLVLLDLSMPGIDGKETFRRLKRVNPDVKVVMSSGFSESEVMHEIDNLGLTGFIQKPYRWDTLVDMLKKFMQEH